MNKTELIAEFVNDAKYAAREGDRERSEVDVIDDLISQGELILESEGWEFSSVTLEWSKKQWFQAI